MTTATLEPETKNLVKAQGVVNFNFNIDSLDKAKEFCAYISNSDMVPKGYKGKPADMIIAGMIGKELGLPFFQALQSIAVINGIPSIYGDAGLALVRSHNVLEDIDEYFELDGHRLDVVDWEDAYTKGANVAAVCMTKRVGMKTPRTTRYSIKDAITAKLWGKKTTKYKSGSNESYQVDSPWITNPGRMLMWRARGFNVRDNFGDIVKGLRFFEEAMDIVDDEPQVTVVDGDAPTPKPKKGLADVLKGSAPMPGFGHGAQAETQTGTVVDTEIVDEPSTVEPPTGATEATADTTTDLLPAIKTALAKLGQTGKGAALVNGIRKTFKLPGGKLWPDEPHLHPTFLKAVEDAITKV